MLLCAKFAVLASDQVSGYLLWPDHGSFNLIANTMNQKQPDMKNVWSVSCFFLLMSCQYAPGCFDGVMANADESMQMEASKSSVDLDRDDSSQPMEAPDAMADRKIIKNAEMLMEVAELDQAALAIKDSLKRYQAFLSETNLFNNTYRSAYELPILVQQQ